MRSPYENNAFVVISRSIPSSQKTAGFGLRIKKNGIKGEKNPTRTPWRMEGPEDDDWERIQRCPWSQSIALPLLEHARYL